MDEYYLRCAHYILVSERTYMLFVLCKRPGEFKHVQLRWFTWTNRTYEHLCDQQLEQLQQVQVRPPCLSSLLLLNKDMSTIV